jgi:hypothetical protein
MSCSHSKAAAWEVVKSSSIADHAIRCGCITNQRYTCRDVGALMALVDGLVEGALEGLELEEGATEGFSEGRAEGRVAVEMGLLGMSLLTGWHQSRAGCVRWRAHHHLLPHRRCLV